ncbi:MAG: hypothetical protein LBL76_01215 [Treponema sp.]|nr:hypothetical protein [Treponema sp.]
MKRYSIGILMSILVISGGTAQTLQGSTMYVAVKNVVVKASTEFFAVEQGTLVYGNQVTVLQEKGKWLEVQAVQSSLQGWVVGSSLTSKRIISSGTRTSASVQELALAGKGFSQELEILYRQDHGFDYDRIDAMETLQVSKTSLYTFLTDGHLGLGD